MSNDDTVQQSARLRTIAVAYGSEYWCDEAIDGDVFLTS